MATASNAEHIVIVTGSAPLAVAAVASIPDEAIVIAVDGGLDHALAAGLHPSGLIGDLDSVSADALEWAEQNATISRHPADKDDTDTELALRFVADMMPTQLTMIGGGDRLDHTFAALGALGLPELTSIPMIDAWWGAQHVDVLHGPGQATLQLAPDSIVSLLALHGKCTGVTITGVRWQLDDATLAPVVGWGVSNQVVADGTVNIRLSTGVLTVFDVPASTTPSTAPCSLELRPRIGSPFPLWRDRCPLVQRWRSTSGPSHSQRGRHARTRSDRTAAPGATVAPSGEPHRVQHGDVAGTPCRQRHVARPAPTALRQSAAPQSSPAPCRS